MKTKLLRVIIISFLLVIVSSNLFAQLQQDSKYGFKINIPADWSKSSSMDGTDKVYDYYSADQNAAIQLRVFEAGGAVTTDMLAQAYEQSYLPPGTQKQSLENHTSKNGIPGKQGSYILNYNETEVVMGNFYTVQNNIGYVLTVIIPSSMLEQKGPEVRQITQSFIIDGFEKTLVLKRETEKPKKGLSGLLGGTNNNQQNNSGFGSNSSSGIANGYNNINRDDVAGRYNFSHRSDGKNMTNYHYIIINKNVSRLNRLKAELQSIVEQVDGVSELEIGLSKEFHRADVYRKHDFEMPSKVLLVDDEQDFVKTLSERLTLRDMGTAVVHDGSSAINLIEQDQPDVMVLDLKMPGVDGFEVLKRVKESTPDVEVIILTGHGNEDDKKECMKMGAFAYLRKPVNIMKLSEVIKEANKKATTLLKSKKYTNLKEKISD